MLNCVSLSTAISTEGNPLLYLLAKFVIILTNKNFVILVTSSGGYYSIHLYISFGDTASETIHVIGQVTNDDDLPLTRYCRIVLKVELD